MSAERTPVERAANAVARVLMTISYAFERAAEGIQYVGSPVCEHHGLHRLRCGLCDDDYQHAHGRPSKLLGG